MDDDRLTAVPATLAAFGVDTSGGPDACVSNREAFFRRRFACFVGAVCAWSARDVARSSLLVVLAGMFWSAQETLSRSRSRTAMGRRAAEARELLGRLGDER
jgi:hypothetical protein